MGDRWRPGRTDTLVALTALVIAVVECALNPKLVPKSAAWPIEIAMALAVGWRRVAPLASAAAVAVLGALLAVAGVPLEEPLIPLLTSVLVAYTLVSYSPRPAALAGSGLLLASLAVQTVLEHKGASNFAFGAVFLAAMWLMGLTVRRRTDIAVKARLDADRATREAEEQARRATLEERERIARELHDVVAHSLSVMVVQAGAVEQLLLLDPERATEAVRSVQQVGREAIGEMGRLLGVLRYGDERIGLAPQPGLGELAALVDQSRSAGLDVSLDLDAHLGSVPPGLGLAIYRVVQEALTNTRKHAGCVSVRVRIQRAGDAVCVEVVDDGPGGTHGPGGGHGLVGMRERVAVYGGSLEAGAQAAGGYAVRAVIPTASSS